MLEIAVLFPIRINLPHVPPQETRILLPEAFALIVQLKIDVELEGSESRLEKKEEPTATTKKAIETVIRGSWVGNVAKHPRRVFDGKFIDPRQQHKTASTRKG